MHSLAGGWLRTRYNKWLWLSAEGAGGGGGSGSVPETTRNVDAFRQVEFNFTIALNLHNLNYL